MKILRNKNTQYVSSHHRAFELKPWLVWQSIDVFFCLFDSHEAVGKHRVDVHCRMIPSHIIVYIYTIHTMTSEALPKSQGHE